MKEYLEFILPVLFIIIFMWFGPTLMLKFARFLAECSIEYPILDVIVPIATIIIVLLLLTLMFFINKYNIVIMPK